MSKSYVKAKQLAVQGVGDQVSRGCDAVYIGTGNITDAYTKLEITQSAVSPVLWLRSDTSATASSGIGSNHTWVSKEGTGKTATSVIANGAGISYTSVGDVTNNFHPYWNFTTNHFKVPDYSGLEFGTGGFEIWMIIRPDGGAYKSLISKDHGNSTWQFHIRSDEKLGANAPGLDPTGTTVLTSNNTTWYAVGWGRDSSDNKFKVFVNSATAESESSANTADLDSSEDLFIGGRLDQDLDYVGAIAEVVIFGETLGSKSRENLIHYFNERYFNDNKAGISVNDGSSYNNIYGKTGVAIPFKGGLSLQADVTNAKYTTGGDVIALYETNEDVTGGA